MLDVLGIIVFTLPLVSLLYYNYHIGYNHDIIKKYKIRNWIPKNEINHHLNSINQKYFINLQLINFNHQELMDFSDLKYDYYDEDEPVTKTDKSIDMVLRVIFSVTISLSIELIILILCELIDFGNTVSVLFHLIIDGLILLIGMIIPFLVINLILNNSLHPFNGSNTKKALTGISYIAWFIILNRFGNLAADLNPKSNRYMSRDLLDMKISQISLLGIVINSLLSGIGSSTLIYRIIVSLSNKDLEPTNEIQEIQLNNLISNYNNLTKMLDKRTHEHTERSVRTGTVYTKPLFKLGNASFDDFGNHSNGILSSKTPQNRIGGIIHKVQSFASLNSLHEQMGSDDLEIHELQNEINQITKSKNHLYNKLTKYLYKFESYHNDQLTTFSHVMDKMTEVLNYGFATYCIYRILNISFIRLPYYFTDDIEDEEAKDAIATTIARIILTINPSIEHKLSEQQIINLTSFFISGSLFLLTFSNVLVTLRSFGRFFPIIINLPKLIKNWLKNLIICELLGMFIISTCLLIRTNLPSNLSFQISKILSLTGSNIENEMVTKKEIKFIDKLFDVIYLVTCTGTMVQFWYQHKSKDTEVDEEEMIEDYKDYKIL